MIYGNNKYKFSTHCCSVKKGRITCIKLKIYENLRDILSGTTESECISIHEGYIHAQEMWVKQIILHLAQLIHIPFKYCPFLTRT